MPASGREREEERGKEDGEKWESRRTEEVSEDPEMSDLGEVERGKKG